MDVVKKLTIQSPDAKTLSEFYLIAKAADGYSVVIYWNELFNSQIGDSFILVTEINGKTQQDSPERILLIATKDLMTEDCLCRMLQVHLAGQPRILHRQNPLLFQLLFCLHQVVEVRRIAVNKKVLHGIRQLA